MIRTRIIVNAFLVISSAPFCSAQVPIAQFSATGLRTNERVGYSVATDGQLVLIGTGAGSAFLYDPFTQQQLAKFTVPDPRFSTSVALEGTTAVIGTRRGAIVYDFSDLSNIVETHLTPDDGPQELFGVSVDLSGDTVIVGANGDDYAGSFTGSAYLFDRETGLQFAKLVADDGEAGDNFGIGVAIDRDRAVVGSVLSKDDQGKVQGAVYLYDASPQFAGDRQLSKYTAPPANSSSPQNFGYQTDISGGHVIALDSKQSFLWRTDEQPTAINGTAAERVAGDPLSIFETLAVVGLDELDRAVIYELDRSRLRTIFSPESNSTGFGFSVAITGDLVVIGSPGSANGGAAYVYLLDDVLVPEPRGATLAFGSVLLLSICRIRGYNRYSRRA